MRLLYVVYHVHTHHHRSTFILQSISFRCFLRFRSSPFFDRSSLEGHGQWQNKSLEVQSFDELNPVWMCSPQTEDYRGTPWYSQIRLGSERIDKHQLVFRSHHAETYTRVRPCQTYVFWVNLQAARAKNMSVRCGRVVVEWT